MLTSREQKKLEHYIHDLDVNRVALAFDALSEPNRCLIFRALLKGQSVRVGDLAKVVGISDSLASQHLKILSQAELVDKAKDGKNVYYHVSAKNPLINALQKAVETKET
jgi:DNA-binding transcriptional ArsR family regulator